MLQNCRALCASLVVTAAVSASAAHAADRDALLAKLPPTLQALYTEPVAVAASAYDAFKAPPKPWRWCHSESYLGNPWRVTANAELKRLVGALQASGDVSEYLVSDSNGDTTQQISQMRSFIDRKCSIITTIAGSSTALDAVIGDAFKAGIPVVTTAGAVTSPYALNVMHNQNLWGYGEAKGLFERIGGKGGVLQVEGIAGHPLVQQEDAGFDKALGETPGVKRLRKVSGEWTASTTKSVVLQSLATTPGKVDAVWSTGSETRVIAEAFKQAGRPLPVIGGSLSGDALGWWHEHPGEFKFFGGEVSPHVAAQNAFRVGLRLLGGQKPLVNTIIAPMPTITDADFPAWFKPCMKSDSTAIFPTPPENPFPEDAMNGYFANGAATPAFDYATVPPACAS